MFQDLVFKINIIIYLTVIAIEMKEKCNNIEKRDLKNREKEDVKNKLKFKLI